MKILITGGAGYIGSVMSEILLNDGHEITVVDKLIYGSNSLNHLFYNQKFNFIKSDVRDFQNYQREIKKSDCIIPLAALVGAPICDQNIQEAFTTNEISVINLFKNLSNEQIVIMPTTNSGYGSGKKNQVFDENSKLNPISRYAVQKEIIEKKLMKRKNSISLRLATVFGSSPRMRLDLLVNDFTHKAYKDKSIILFEKEFRRNFIHVRDVARCFSHCLNNFDSMKKNIYNLGLSDSNLTKLELCKKIKKYVPDFVIISKNIKTDLDKRNYIVSNKKIELTGFKTQFTIDDGIAELLKLYKSFKYFENGNI